jgi:hypothetical protein
VVAVVAVVTIHLAVAHTIELAVQVAAVQVAHGVLQQLLQQLEQLTQVVAVVGMSQILLVLVVQVL